jgi:AcrR family transcriptional regulator
VVFSLSTDVSGPADAQALSRTRQARREQLLRTARTAFLELGYTATTMEHIAEAAAVSKATLYKYFPDKDELFFTLVRETILAPSPRLKQEHKEIIALTIAHLERHAGHAEVKQALLQHIKTGADRRNDAFFRLMLELSLARPMLLQRVSRELHSGHDDLLTLTPEVAAKLPSGVDGRALVHLLFVAITGYTLLEDVVFGPKRIDAERLADTFATLLCAAME